MSSIRDEEADFDRLLATVMFTDIVDSTRQSAAMGDQAWRSVRRDTTASSVRSSRDAEVARSAGWATASSPPSTAPGVP
jgi:class 3 adenylate cyclase